MDPAGLVTELPGADASNTLDVETTVRPDSEVPQILNELPDIPPNNQRICEKVNLSHIRHYLKHYKIPKELKQLEFKERRRRSHSLLSRVKNFSLDEDGSTVWYCGRIAKKKTKVLFGPDQVTKALQEFHPYDNESTHPGKKKLLNMISSNYYWTSITKDVYNWVATCPTCIQKKRLQITHDQKIFMVDEPMEVIRLDIIGPFPDTCRGNHYVISLTDVFSKWIEAEPIAEKSTEVIISFMDRVYYRLGGAEKTVLTLTRDLIRKVKRRASVVEGEARHAIVSGRFPVHENDANEYDNKLNIIQFCNSRNITWDEDLPQLLWALRSRRNSQTGMSPYRIMFGREPRLFTKALDDDIEHIFVLSNKRRKNSTTEMTD